MLVTTGCSPSSITTTILFDKNSSSFLFDSCFYDNSSFCEDSSSLDTYSSELSFKQESLYPNDISSSKMGNEENTDSFIFFTDPHLFLPTPELDYSYSWFNQNIPLLQRVYNSTPSSFIMCGGDLLNNNDSKEMAKNRIRLFVDKMSSSFESFHIIVGNHDTNYQGDSYMSSGNYDDCKLSQEELNSVMFDGNKAYYCFDTITTRYYCFDSGIDWDSLTMNDYRWEQINWFASELLIDPKPHKTIFIHIALKNNNLTPLMENIGLIVSAFNSRNKIEINGYVYNYSSSNGTIDFIEAGHEHKDLNTYSCGGIPVIITTNFSSPTKTEQPTFDYVSVDYNKKTVACERYGEGNDRAFLI